MVESIVKILCVAKRPRAGHDILWMAGVGRARSFASLHVLYFWRIIFDQGACADLEPSHLHFIP
jgi:hypothetical protein